jgi:hypothetical protein
MGMRRDDEDEKRKKEKKKKGEREIMTDIIFDFIYHDS